MSVTDQFGSGEWGVDDSLLLDRWRQHGDAEALNHLARRYSGLVYGVGMRVLRRPEDAQDVAQDCFLKLATLRQPVRSLPGLLHTMATRMALNRLRRDARRRDREDAYAEAHPDTTDHAWDDMQDLVDTAIAALPEKYQVALVRHYLQGETHDDIAKDLGLTRSAVTQQCRRGIAQVREILRRRGVTVAGAFLATGLTAQQGLAAPPSVQASIGRMAISGHQHGTTARLTAALKGGGFQAAFLATALVGIVVAGVFMGGLGRERKAAATTPAAPATTSQETATPKVSPNPMTSAASAASPEPVISLEGRVVSDQGFPRPTVHLSFDWPYGIYGGEESDANGRFRFEVIPEQADALMAYCQYTQRAGLVSRAELPASGTLEVVLDRRIIHLLGRAVNPDGHGIPKTPVEVKVVSADGTTFRGGTLYADREGYYQTSFIPATAGDTIAVRRAAFAENDASPWRAMGVVDTHQTSLILAPLTVSEAIAEAVLGSVSLAELSSCAVDHLITAQPRVLYGGSIKNPKGGPIAGVTVPIFYTDREDRHMSASVTTDASGRWEFLLPADLRSVSIRPKHPDYVPWELMDRRASPSLEDLRARTAEVTLTPGVPLRGIVLDAEGAPAHDVVVLTHTMYSRLPGGSEVMANAPIEDASTARTAADGTFQLNCLPEGRHTLRFSKPGKAPVSQVVEVGRGKAPVTIRLSAGTTLAGRVLDPGGNPVPGAFLQGSTWYLKENTPLHVGGEADANGRFILEGVPEAGTVAFRVGLPKEAPNEKNLAATYVTFKEPRAESYDITLYPPTTWTGRVIDATTGEPVKRFEVRCGTMTEEGTPHWGKYSDREAQVSPEGLFDYTLNGYSFNTTARPTGTPAEATGRYIIGVMARGYAPGVSPPAMLGATPDVTIELTPQDALKGRVLGIDGLPLEDVTVGWVPPGGRAFLQGHHLVLNNSNKPDPIETTRNGGIFRMYSRQTPGELVAVHRDGFAFLEHPPEGGEITVQLQAWVEVEGVYTINGSPAANQELYPLYFPEQDRISPLALWITDRTKEDGKFRWNHIPPLPFELGQWGWANGYTSWRIAEHVNPAPGERVWLDLTLDGTDAVGAVTMPPDLTAQAVDNGHLEVFAYRGAFQEEFDPSHDSRVFVAETEDNLTFTFEALPPGRYEGRAVFRERAYHRYDEDGPRYVGDFSFEVVDLNTVEVDVIPLYAENAENL
jgi:RNA polymerase sigma-70 factor (ECF subfamily)